MADPDFESDDEIFDFEEEEEEQQLVPERRNREQLRKLRNAQARTFSAMAEYERLAGDEALNDILSQCERRLNWQVECVSDRATIEDILLKKYDIYDPDTWIRYRNSWFEKRLRNDMHHIGMMHSSMFARALARKKLPFSGRAMLYVRELFWSLVQKLDRKLQSS